MRIQWQPVYNHRRPLAKLGLNLVVDLVEIHALAVNLDHGVPAAEDSQSAISVKPADVASPVEPTAQARSHGLGPLRVVNESLCCGFRVVQVTPCQLRPLEQKLTGGAEGRQVVVVIHINDPGSGTVGSADVGMARLESQYITDGDRDGDFCWAITCRQY